MVAVFSFKTVQLSFYENLCVTRLEISGMLQMKGKFGEVGVRMYDEGRKWVLNSILFADDTVLIAEIESDLQNLVNAFDSVCKRRKLKVNVNKSKVMVC